MTDSGYDGHILCEEIVSLGAVAAMEKQGHKSVVSLAKTVLTWTEIDETVLLDENYTKAATALLWEITSLPIFARVKTIEPEPEQTEDVVTPQRMTELEDQVKKLRDEVKALHAWVMPPAPR